MNKFTVNNEILRAVTNKDELRNILENLSKSDNLYVKLFDTSRSGLSCKARVFTVLEDLSLYDITYYINSLILDKTKSVNEDIKIQGGGMSKRLILTSYILGLESQSCTEI